MTFNTVSLLIFENYTWLFGKAYLSLNEMMRAKFPTAVSQIF